MNKCAFLLILVLSAFSNSLNAQTIFWDSPNAYLGQTPPGDTPVKFAPQLINDTPYFSMDRMCIFIRWKGILLLPEQHLVFQ